MVLNIIIICVIGLVVLFYLFQMLVKMVLNIIITSVIGLVVLFYFFQTRNSNYWKNRGVPFASKGHWFFGHFKQFLYAEEHFGVVYQNIYNEYPEAPYIGTMKFSQPALLIKDPDIIKAVLSTDFHNFEANELQVDKKHDFLLGNNPFFLRGQEWKTSRSHASPLTTFAKLKMFLPTINQVGSEMVKYIGSKYDDRGIAELEAKDLAGKFTIDVVANAVFGVKNNTFQDENPFFGQVIADMASYSVVDMVRMVIGFAFPQLMPFIAFRMSSKKNEDLLLSLTKKVMKERDESNEVRNDIFQQMKVFRDNDKNGVFTDEYITSHCFGFIADGYETSSDVLCFTLFELAWHPDCQDRLRNEIMTMISETNDEYNAENVEKLKYLDMVVCEGLRLFPPLTVLTRLCTTEYTVAGEGSLTIEMDTPIHIPAYAIHRDEKYYPNPEQFDPERFTEEAVAKRHKFVYLPFGEGPRKCVGQRFGMFQVKVAILTIIRNYRLTPSPKSQYPVKLDPAEFITRPLNGAWIQFEGLEK